MILHSFAEHKIDLEDSVYSFSDDHERVWFYKGFHQSRLFGQLFKWLGMGVHWSPANSF